MTGITAQRYAQRLAIVADIVRDDSAAMLVSPGADLIWLTGYRAVALERLTLLIVAPGRAPVLLVPRLEEAAAREAPAVATGLVKTITWQETQDPIELVGEALTPRPARVSISDQSPATLVLRLQAMLPGIEFGLASTILSELRAIKDVEEIDLLQRAARAADRTVLAVAAGRLVGRSEADVAREVRERLVEEGHDQASFWIVASGPNSASPHHEPGERLIEAGEPVLFDIGGQLGGYGSDITRVAWVTGGMARHEPPPAFVELYRIVRTAQERAVAAVRPGVTCASIDQTARSVIADAGYGEAFIHRTGHGIGLETHESPYIVAGNETILRPGHAFSIEPGIYLEGRYGARLEEIVVCTAEGVRVLSEARRDLLVGSGL